MKLENTYHLPRLLINNKEVGAEISGNVSFSSNNSVNKLSVSIKDPSIKESRLFNAKVEFYLNAGSEDSVPIFRGFIKEANHSEEKVSITAYDPRMLLQGTNSIQVNLTDEDNYDGYSLAGFLQDFITNSINVDEVLIGLDMLSDTSPIVTMNGERGVSSVYDMTVKKLKESIDSSDVEKPLTYFLDIIEGDNYSNISFIKEKPLTDAPVYNYSFTDGIMKLSNKRRAPTTIGVYEGGKFTYGNSPEGIKSMNVKLKKKDSASRAELRNEAIKQVILKYQETDEISAKVSKGFYVSLGSIVRLNIDKEGVVGNHRVSAKQIKFGDNIICTLSLNKKPIKISSYIN